MRLNQCYGQSGSKQRLSLQRNILLVSLEEHFKVLNGRLMEGRKSSMKEYPMTDTQYDENLFVVFAVEEYARRHKISAHEALGIFLKFGITESIRQCYKTLRTQDIYECVSFAEDILKRKNV